MAINFTDLIHNSILAQTDYLNSNEFAYLSLTSKNELPFRDKIAFALHQELEKEFAVAREYKGTLLKKIDLAILSKNGEPEVLIEFKAVSSIVYTESQEFHNMMISDLKKCAINGHNNPEIYFIVMANWFPQTVEFKSQKHLKGIVKYLDKINKHPEFSGMKKRAITSWESFLRRYDMHQKFRCCEFEGGLFENNRINYLVFINGPFTNNEIAKLK